LTAAPRDFSPAFFIEKAVMEAFPDRFDDSGAAISFLEVSIIMD